MMNRNVFWTGTALISIGLGLFSYRFLGLDMPVFPAHPEGLWLVEYDLTVQGQGPGSVQVALPTTNPHQIIFDESSSSDGFDLVIEHDGPNRWGRWSGPMQGKHRVAHKFRVRLTGETFELPSAPYSNAVPDEVSQMYLHAPTPDLAAETAGKACLAHLDLPPLDDPAGRLRTVYAFMKHRVQTQKGGASDAAGTLTKREGSAIGRARGLETLLRAAQLPARMVTGVALQENAQPKKIYWVEAYVARQWVSLSADGTFFAERPSNVLQLRYGDAELTKSAVDVALNQRIFALRQRLSRQELANSMLPDRPFLSALSLYRLPVPTQKVLHLLLLLPLGALMVSIYRNFIGFRTFGTFMPILIALSLSATDLKSGLLALALVMGIGVGMRRGLDRLRLLVVPRISLLLCIVVLCIVGLALTADHVGAKDLFSGVFPLIVITMLVERISLVIAEESTEEALRRGASSAVIALLTYPLFKSITAKHLMFGFPELVLVIMGGLVFVGGYTGFRVTDYLRFRGLQPSSANTLSTDLLGAEPARQGAQP